jgi:hypothetical protein
MIGDEMVSAPASVVAPARPAAFDPAFAAAAPTISSKAAAATPAAAVTSTGPFPSESDSPFRSEFYSWAGSYPPR